MKDFSVSDKAAPAEGHNSNNQFELIDREVRGMSLEQGEVRFAAASHLEVMTNYERGAILYHAESVWFEGDEAGFENWVLNNLRIPLELARKFKRVYLAILHSELSSDDFKGIPISSIGFLIPVLRHADGGQGPMGDPDKYKRYKEALPGLLDLARSSSVKKLKKKVYELRGIDVPTDEKETVKTLTLNVSDIDRVNKILQTLGNELKDKGMSCAFAVGDPESKRVVGYCTPDWKAAFQETVDRFGVMLASETETPMADYAADLYADNEVAQALRAAVRSDEGAEEAATTE